MTRMLDILEDYLRYKEYEYCRIDGQTTVRYIIDSFIRVKIVRNVWMNLMIQIQQNSALF